MCYMKGTIRETIQINFNNTATAFAYKSNEELNQAAWLFRMMRKTWLIDWGSSIGTRAMRWNLPFAESLIQATIFKQFCSGTTLLNSQVAIDQLYKYKVKSILDYGAEGKTTEKDFNNSMTEAIRAIEFASRETSISTISIKITALARTSLLAKIQTSEALSEEEDKEYKYILKRVDSICHVAQDKNVQVYIDAEESWIQDTIDFITRRMMRRYNKKKPIVYTTIQLYIKNRLQHLIDCYEDAKKEKYILGAKLVRGAYLEKERKRAKELGYPSPIQTNKKATDKDYNTAIQFCVDHYLQIASVAATHNQESCLLQASLIAQKGIPKNHPHLSFSQLYGMSDNLTFNLAAEGYNTSKYMVYGPVKEVIPFLIRRAQENSAVLGEVGREYQLVLREMKRRGIG